MHTVGRSLALLLIVGLALGLRLWHLEFGLPDWYHPDEPIKARAIARIVRGDLHPGSLYHPSFMLYAAALTARLTNRGAAVIDEIAAARAGRLTVALLGTATVALTFVAGCAVRDASVGLIAALLLAVAPLHVTCSRYLKEDVPMTFWAVAVFLACLPLTVRDRRRDYICAGVLAGLTAGTKYTGLLFVALPWLAERERTLPTRERWEGEALSEPSETPKPTTVADRTARTEARPPWLPDRSSFHLRLALMGSIVGFLAVTPFALIDLPQFLRGLAHGAGNVVSGMGGIAVPPRLYWWGYHLRYSLLPGIGWLPTLLALAGFITALRQPAAATRLLAVIAAALYTVYESSPYKPPPNADRHVVPLLPFMALLAATALADWRARSGRVGTRLADAAAVLAAGLALLGSLRLGATIEPDTRAVARAWLQQHACNGERILLEGALNAGGVLVPAYVAPLPPPCRAEYTYSLERERHRLAELDLLVASSFMYERFLRLPSASGVRSFYEDLFARGTLVAEFTPTYWSYGFHNPTIRVYRLARAAVR